MTVALGLLAFDLAGDDAGAVLGTALAIKMIAYVFVAPVSSALTDRIPRRVLLVSSDVVRAGIALCLPFVGAVWQIYVLAFVLQAASATFTPALQTVILAMLVDEDDYTRGLSLTRLAYDAESLLSPLLAAAMLTLVHYNSLFVCTAAGFVISATIVARTKLPQVQPADRSMPLMVRITGGARIMAGDPVLRGLLAMNMVVAAATALVVVNTVVYVLDLFAGSDSEVALMLACYGAGSIAATLAVPRALAWIGDRALMLSGCALMVIGLAAAAVITVRATPSLTWWLLLTLAWLVLGSGTSLVSTPSKRLLRARSDAMTRASVFTAQFSVSHACFLLTYPLAGWVGVVAGQTGAAVSLAVLATLAALTASLIWPPSMRSGTSA